VYARLFDHRVERLALALQERLDVGVYVVDVHAILTAGRGMDSRFSIGWLT
jgi:hypothetical protein